MAKNIVLCCDGTSNEFARDRTNVAKLCLALEKDPRRQLVYYHPGLGTMAPPGLATPIGNWFGRLAGLGLGYGIKHDISDAYAFIMNHFEEGDRIFLFGFSRGAYTARAIAGLLHMYGLAMPGNEPLIPYAVRMMWEINRLRARRDDDRIAAYFKLAAEFKAALGGPDCKPHFVGVWDTVSSVGWIGSPVALPYTRNNPDVAITRHAIAIDERRAFFRTNRYAPAPDRNLREVWFPGTHSDVGGGHPESESGLSKIALDWMIGEARIAGLMLDPDRLALILGRAGQGYAAADPNAVLHDSMTMLWRLAEFVPKRHWNSDTKRQSWRINAFKRRAMGPAPIVHDAAWARAGGYAARLPADAVRLSETSPLEGAKRDHATIMHVVDG